MVGAGFQRDIGCCARGRIAAPLGIAQRHDFGMRFTRTFVPAFTEEQPIFDQHTPHARIDTGRE